MNIVARLCRREGITYRELATHLGISQSYACQLRLGRKPMTLSVARRLATLTGYTLDDLFGGGDRMAGTVKNAAGPKKGKKAK